MPNPVFRTEALRSYADRQCPMRRISRRGQMHSGWDGYQPTAVGIAGARLHAAPETSMETSLLLLSWRSRQPMRRFEECEKI